MREDARLAPLSVPQAEVLAAWRGARIALVGNARALAGTRRGTEIDAADHVIRINRAPMPDVASHGTRTDALALATRLAPARLADLSPARVMWMSPKRKRLTWAVATTPGFYLHPRADYDALKARLGAPPTTGAMMIDLLARSGAARVDLFGFDFFASLSLSGRRQAADVPHDFGAEATWVHTLIAQDSRFILHPNG
nr:glycosyltransferase family 29 protein [Falsirhodobacter halotolerans]